MALTIYIKDEESELSIISSTFWQHMSGKGNLHKKCELKPSQPLLQQCDHASVSVIQMASELANKVISIQSGQTETCTLFPFNNIFIHMLFPIHFSHSHKFYTSLSRLNWPHFVSANHYSAFFNWKITISMTTQDLACHVKVSENKRSANAVVII